MKKPFIQRKCWTRWLIYLSSVPFIIPPLCFAASDVGGKPEKTEIVVTYPQPSGSSTPLWVAYEAGLFKKYGLVASLQVLSPQASVQAVVSGSADFAGVGAELLSARLQGARLKVIAATLENLVFQMWGAKDITNIQHLRGKTVAVSSPRSLIEIATREVLKKNGLIGEKDVKFLPAQTVSAILNVVLAGQAAAGTLSAPTTLKAREAGLNLVADIGRLNIPGLQTAYGVTEQYLNENPNTIEAFVKAMAEGIVLTRKDPATAKRAIAKYTKTEDSRMVDEAYEAFAPHWAKSLAVRREVVQAWFGYLDEKEYPQARNADPREFYDNSFVNRLESSGFFQKIGWAR
jgi:NitT/TauT family transport system substrate-binding protein